MTPNAGGPPFAAANRRILTKREEQVRDLLLDGMLYKEIGDALGLSISTVRSHQRNLYHKCGVHTRCELCKLWRMGNCQSQMV